MFAPHLKWHPWEGSERNKGGKKQKEDVENLSKIKGKEN